MTTITITAKRWSGGWELWHGDDVWTQVATLDRAEQQVRDYLDTQDEGTDHSDWEIAIVPDIPGLGEIRKAQQAMADALTSQRNAAQAMRAEIQKLRRSFSVTDTAAILGVSRGRVSQLAK